MNIIERWNWTQYRLHTRGAEVVNDPAQFREISWEAVDYEPPRAHYVSPIYQSWAERHDTFIALAALVLGFAVMAFMAFLMLKGLMGML